MKKINNIIHQITFFLDNWRFDTDKKENTDEITENMVKCSMIIYEKAYPESKLLTETTTLIEKYTKDERLHGNLLNQMEKLAYARSREQNEKIWHSINAMWWLAEAALKKSNYAMNAAQIAAKQSMQKQPTNSENTIENCNH